MKHDLVQYLHELQLRYPELARRDLSVTWYHPANLPDNEPIDCWGWHEAPTPAYPHHQIFILSDLQRAPKYVVRYLLLHEVLHVLMPDTGHHPRRFQLAERAHPDFCRANDWLTRHIGLLDAWR